MGRLRTSGKFWEHTHIHTQVDSKTQTGRAAEVMTNNANANEYGDILGQGVNHTLGRDMHQPEPRLAEATWLPRPSSRLQWCERSPHTRGGAGVTHSE
jgi:hypothetical protein